jgi:hypothetical protein
MDKNICDFGMVFNRVQNMKKRTDDKQLSVFHCLMFVNNYSKQHQFLAKTVLKMHCKERIKEFRGSLNSMNSVFFYSDTKVANDMSKSTNSVSELKNS